MPSHDLIHMFMNNHEWYHIDTPLDYVRAGIWVVANFATFLAYFLIPNELRHWGRVLPFSAAALLVTLFVAFIIACGLSHLAMLFIMQTAPWWAVLLVYLPMAVISVATIIVIRRDRKVIISVLEKVARALKEEPR